MHAFTRRRAVFLGKGVPLGALALAAACSAAPTGELSAALPSPGPGPEASPGAGGSGGVSFDDSPPVRAARTPPAVSGGTLLALRSGHRVVVADSDRDRVMLVNLDAGSVEAELALGDGSEPGRLAEDALGRVHVVLRGTGELATVDPLGLSVVARRSVCAAPRGVAYDSSQDLVAVTCLEGKLVELPPGGGEATRITELGSDLRDVVFSGGRLAVTFFREASLLFLDAHRRPDKAVKLTDVAGFAPSVAWRAAAMPDGSVAIVHQRSFSGEINVEPGADSGGSGGTNGHGQPLIEVDGGTSDANDTGGAAETAAGGSGAISLPPRTGYGSRATPCGAVVQGTFSVVGQDGSVTSGPNLVDGVLPVDIAISSDGYTAIALGGLSPTSPSSGVIEFRPGNAPPQGSCFGGELLGHSAAVAVAFEPGTHRLAVLHREPPTLEIVEVGAEREPLSVALGGVSVRDTGHELFNTDAGGGLACASCHPEGTDDSRVWRFSDLGPRRTQPLDVGLAGTAPFHWNGEFGNFSTLMGSIFVERMGGPHESEERVSALEEYVYTFGRRPAKRDVADAAALRGKRLFESAEAACSSCHAGPNLANGRSYDIGKGPPLQVPSLIAVSARAPYMHDGCAATLLERFDPACGGSAHGDVSELAPAELADLVAYLEAL